MTQRAQRPDLAQPHRYRIERELGAGGMATVYLAEALEVLHPASAASPDRRIGRTRGTVVPCLVLALVACAAPGDRGPAPFDRGEATAAVAGVLDALHHNASVADEEAYFALFAPEGVFFGTDATERWTVEEFRAYAHPYFERGQGWTYVLRQGTRHVDFDPTGRVAWFDEILDNASYGETRGTGVMRLIDGAWKITQYHLTIPVPNALADTVVEMIRRLEQAPSP